MIFSIFSVAILIAIALRSSDAQTVVANVGSTLSSTGSTSSTNNLGGTSSTNLMNTASTSTNNIGSSSTTNMMNIGSSSTTNMMNIGSSSTGNTLSSTGSSTGSTGSTGSTNNNNNIGNIACSQREAPCTINTGTSGFCVPFSMASSTTNNNNSNNNNVYNFNLACQVLPMAPATMPTSTCTQFYSSCAASSSAGSSSASASLCLPMARTANGTLVFACSSLPSATTTTTATATATQQLSTTPTSTATAAAMITCFTPEIACNINGAATGYCLPYSPASSVSRFNYACQPLPAWVDTMPESTCTTYYSSCAASSAGGASSSASATLCLPTARKANGTFVFACSALPSTIATTTTILPGTTTQLATPVSTVAVVTCYTRELACNINGAVTGYCLPYSPAGTSFAYACQPLPVWVDTMPDSTCTQLYAACSAADGVVISASSDAPLCLPWARKADGTFVFKCSALPVVQATATTVITATKGVTFTGVFNSAPTTALGALVLLVAILAHQF